MREDYVAVQLADALRHVESSVDIDLSAGSPVRTIQNTNKVERQNSTPTYESGASTKCLLTFDDGPHPSVTPRILDTLAELNISALFFVVGSALQSSAGMALARRAVAEGHVLGNHTFHHRRLIGIPDGEVRAELQRTDDLICECAGSCLVFRPPYGAVDQALAGVVADMGYKILLWNVDTLDWKLRYKGAWVAHASAQIVAEQEAVILMHDIHQSTAANLPMLVDLLAKDPARHIANASTWAEFLPRFRPGGERFSS